MEQWEEWKDHTIPLQYAMVNEGDNDDDVG